MRIPLAIPVCLLLFLAPAAAEDKPKQPQPVPSEQTAVRVLAAVKAKDQTALKVLAARDKPDPWLVADELCYRGEHDAAEAFAKAAPRVDVAKLPGYVASRRGKQPSAAARKAMAAAIEAARAGNHAVALAALAAVGTTAADVTSVRVLRIRGVLLRAVGRLEESSKAYSDAAMTAETLGWLAGATDSLMQCATSARDRADLPAAHAAWERFLAIAELRPNRLYVAVGHQNIGNIQCSLGDYAKAFVNLERTLAIFETLENPGGVASALGNLGNTHRTVGNYDKALDYLERCLSLMEKLENRRGVAITLGGLGLVHGNLGSYKKALDFQQRCFKQAEEVGHRRQAAAALMNMGILYKRLASYEKALEYQESGLARMEALKDQAGVAEALGNIGIIHQHLGAHAKALDYLERTLKILERLGRRAGVAATQGNIAMIHLSLGDIAEALAYQQRSLKLADAIGHKSQAAVALGNLGLVHRHNGNLAKAFEYQQRALAMREELGDRAGVAAAHVNIGKIHQSRMAHADALASYERGLKLAEAIGHPQWIAIAIGNIGDAHRSMGSYTKALKHLERARVMAVELGLLDIEVRTLGALAFVHLRLEEPGKAARVSREGVEKLSLLVSGLADEQAADARAQWAGLMENGVLAGMQQADAAEVCFFLESGRAGALLEALGGRGGLGAILPKELGRQELDARAALLQAQAHLGRAFGTPRAPARNRAGVRAAREELRTAHDGVLNSVAKIQRAAKRIADVAYPKAAALKELRAALRPGEALVSYATIGEAMVALVVKPDGATIVPLATFEIALELEDPEMPWRDRAARLRKAVIEPLGLGKETKRILVSPAGALSYIPFSVLAPEYEVAYVPSGTTYTVLLEERGKRGSGVLALGDPDYARHRGFTRLPGTRAEAKTIGDRVLLGEHASETTFVRTVGKAERWRAVHLACHGLVNPERPLLSSLALTPDAANDGFLTVVEVFRAKIRADLVVLSACETARGKVYRTEGIVGFTRAFMFAGAPRVICSLWKVDDEATQTLMIKFYELWNPEDGEKGVGAAAALKQAQAFIRGQEKWKHPYYWAAWVLWGLPN